MFISAALLLSAMSVSQHMPMALHSDRQRFMSVASPSARKAVSTSALKLLAVEMREPSKTADDLTKRSRAICVANSNLGGATQKQLDILNYLTLNEATRLVDEDQRTLDGMVTQAHTMAESYRATRESLQKRIPGVNVSPARSVERKIGALPNTGLPVQSAPRVIIGDDPSVLQSDEQVKSALALVLSAEAAARAALRLDEKSLSVLSGRMHRYLLVLEKMMQQFADVPSGLLSDLQ